MSALCKTIRTLGIASVLLLGLNGCIMVAGTAVTSTASGVGMENSLQDRTIRLRAMSMFSNYPILQNNSNIDVVVYNGTVLLVGEVPNQEVKDALAYQISTIPGVVIVYNHLTIGIPANFADKMADAMLTTRVVSALTTNGINTLRIKVVTENATVYMFGLVTPEQGQRASEVASRVSGVFKVVEVYEYI